MTIHESEALINFGPIRLGVSAGKELPLGTEINRQPFLGSTFPYICSFDIETIRIIASDNRLKLFHY